MVRPACCSQTAATSAPVTCVTPHVTPVPSGPHTSPPGTPVAPSLPPAGCDLGGTLPRLRKRRSQCTINLPSLVQQRACGAISHFLLSTLSSHGNALLQVMATRYFKSVNVVRISPNSLLPSPLSQPASQEPGPRSSYRTAPPAPHWRAAIHFPPRARPWGRAGSTCTPLHTRCLQEAGEQRMRGGTRLRSRTCHLQTQDAEKQQHNSRETRPRSRHESREVGMGAALP